MFIYLCGLFYVAYFLWFCFYLLQLLGDAKAGVDPLSAFFVFRLVVFQEIAPGELSSYKPDQRQV